jgi:hypothetical protein
MMWLTLNCRSSQAGRQHAGLGEQHARGPHFVRKIAKVNGSALSQGSASILLALAGMLQASHRALGLALD